MKERPILFSAPMVRAILAGHKTQTRRVVKPQPIYGDVMGTFASWMFQKRRRDLGHWLYPNAREYVLAECPYGVPDDRLWVRETHEVRIVGTELFHGHRCVERVRHYAKVAYQADDGRAELGIDDATFERLDEKESKGWSPSIHMPRWASRITLEVTNVRVERLQEISYEDAIAEGVGDFANSLLGDSLNAIGETPEQTARRLEWPQRQYRNLWDSLNAARGYGWDVNPWVWVIEFRRISPCNA